MNRQQAPSCTGPRHTDGTGWPDCVPSYSYWPTPEQLLDYFGESGRDHPGGDDGRVLVFTGVIVDCRFDGEPTVLPDGAPITSMTWTEFLPYANSRERVESAIPARRPNYPTDTEGGTGNGASSPESSGNGRHARCGSRPHRRCHRSWPGTCSAGRQPLPSTPPTRRSTANSPWPPGSSPGPSGPTPGLVPASCSSSVPQCPRGFRSATSAGRPARHQAQQAFIAAAAAVLNGPGRRVASVKAATAIPGWFRRWAPIPRA